MKPQDYIAQYAKNILEYDLPEIAKELDRLKAENETLKAKADWTLFDNRVETLQKENTLLKNALFHIASEDKLCKDCSIDLESHYQSIAHEALKGGE